MEFETFNLTDLYTISSGLSKNRKYFGTGTPFLTFKDVFDNLILPNEFSGQVITEEKEREKYSVKKGDLFLTRTSEKQNELGISAVALKDYKNATFNGFTKRLRPNKYCENKLLPVYAAFYFRSNNFRNQVNSMSIMSTRASLNNEMISKLKITIPSLQNQMKISHILLALLKKEKINQKIIANLEELSQTLFKRWFVDFEFPDENGNPYKSSGGEMIDSEMGLIPRGWEVKSADEIYEITIGKTPPRKLTELFSEKEGIDWVSISDMKSEGMFIKSTKEKIIEEGVVDYKVKIVPKDSVLLSFKLTIGRVKLTNKELTTNEAIAHFYSSNINKLYTYLYLKNFEYGYLGNTSSIATAVNSKIIKKMPILVPEQKVLKRFINIAEPFMNRINIIQNENIELNQLRDTLLPKLMSGEIEIPDDIEVNEDELSI
ncbi:restriction endonuclease subunit S [Staphylococcus pseudintermedius]|uniref:restriction endonuclease subunit S n=13 Tax=Staphylococcus pseudintermedius TaxID=283734 RepID=UPI00055DC5BE|nr:restriction endonuclease subunit S [Staphylococcus pseudintermedius]ANQ87204.1 restriction endonuclease subunit S [Staphylococcus pseudintermedius]AYG55465.1 restriction endonuclease subunit S [Staphylococcus pseudintermedius]EGQ0328790.1 restriction endonuclease subunit S [Staphylococcus pseudintermedius]EGQ0394782.1 restriction endonuclease subunit S [Staphylococcus pseudintermedius]EGQ1314232.1 restriction endonuclease subunit S [Staphylococcus pseudintermedius]